MPIFKVITGPEPGKQYRLDRPRTVIGRHPDCDVIVEVGAVSRHHAAVVQEDGQYFVEDLNSRNGTYVNDQPIETRLHLNPHDRIRVCDVVFEFDWQRSDPQWTGESESTKGSTVLIDDELDTKNSTIMSRLDVSAQEGSTHAASSATVKLAAVLEVTQSLGKALSLDEVLPQLLNSLFKIFAQADRGFIVLKQDDGNLIPKWTKVRHEEMEDTIRISRTIINRAMGSGEAFLSADAASDERFEMSQSIADFRIRSVMCAPLINSEGDCLGALQIDTLDQKSRFQPADLEVLASMASQAAVAINNAELHDKALQQERFQQELNVAQEVQQSFLPRSRPTFGDYRFFDYYKPANQIGGDYFDYVALPDGRIAVIVADVVGHGVAAALLMAKLSSESKFCLAIEHEPAEVVRRLNNKLCADNLDDRFVTSVLAVINPPENDVTIVNAGHMAPLHSNGSEQVEEIGASLAGVPLGVIEDFEYEQCRFSLRPNELCTIYTDGLNEAANSDGELYGLHRVRQKVAAQYDSPENLVNGLVADVARFVGDEPQGDDMCIVSFGRA